MSGPVVPGVWDGAPLACPTCGRGLNIRCPCCSGRAGGLRRAANEARRRRKDALARRVLREGVREGSGVLAGVPGRESGGQDGVSEESPGTAAPDLGSDELDGAVGTCPACAGKLDGLLYREKDGNVRCNQCGHVAYSE